VAFALPDGFDEWPPAVQKYFIDELHKKMPKLKRPWYGMARPKQLPPDHKRHHLADDNGYYCHATDPKSGEEHKCAGQDDWYIWLICTGRRTGKTLAGANWLLEQALKYPKSRWIVLEPTFRQIDEVAFRGKAGIIAQAQPGEIVDYNKNNKCITLRNGSEIFGFSADAPDSIRGMGFWGAWLDEIRDYDTTEIFTTVLEPALAEGKPRILATSTPGPGPLLMKWYEQYWEDIRTRGHSNIHFTPMETLENKTLPPDYLERVKIEMTTHWGRQEYGGEFLDDFQGALWNRDVLDRNRVMKDEFYLDDGEFDFGKFRRIVIGFDPSMSISERSDEHGIIVAGEGVDGHGYLIADVSLKGATELACREVCKVAKAYGAECVVTEANQAGDWLVSGLRAVDPEVTVRKVHAMKGKYARAQPVSNVAATNRIHHIGEFPKLEIQLCSLTPDSDRNKRHDDRADAFVWAMTNLLPDMIGGGSWMSAYNMCYCKECGQAFNKVYSKCPKCGHEIGSEESKTPRPSSWAAAYMNVCPKCGTQFTVREKQCPSCHPTPASYMSQVGRMTGKSNWMQYTEKNWLQGRKF
jgi:phage terminase large subunit-like protein